MLVYRCTNLVSGKVYVGKTSATLHRRWREHQSAAKQGSPYLFHRAIRKYGAEAFQVEVLAAADTQEALDVLEAHFISELGSQAPGGYNLRAGGEGGPHSQKTRELLRLQALGRRLSPEHREAIGRGVTGPRNGFYGRTHTEATKQVLREKCGVAHVGVPLAAEHRAKISAALTGKSKSDAQVQRMRDNMLGKKLTPEQADRLHAACSVALKGRPKSEAHRQKLRESALRRAALRRGESCKI